MKKKIGKLLLVCVGLVGLLFLFGIGKKFYEEYQHRQYVAGLSDTASPQVQVLQDTAYIDYLDEKRTLRIYLPPSYHTDTLSYPVIYFLDADAIFSDLILEGPEWQVDEVLDSMARIGGQEAIVIGIDNSGRRSSEYKPYVSDQIPGETSVTGDQHAEWIATDLKNWVDQNFRTQTEAQHTAIAGASLGGIMSYYITMTFPDIFGRAIVFSPSFWVNDSIFSIHTQVKNLPALRIYMNVGNEEGTMVDNAQKMYDLLLTAGMPENQIQFDILPGKGHSHPTWREGFKRAYPWILE